MTTDMENELRDLFREKAGEAPIATPAAAPQRLLRRGRLHQVGTVIGSAAIVLVVVAGSMAGLNALLRSEGDPFGTGEKYEVFERVATVEAFTVGSPSDWYLVNHWPASMNLAVSSGPASECTASPLGGEVCIFRQPADRLEPRPYGLPMFQLSNTDLGLDRNACRDGLPDDADDAAVLYVALDYERAIAGIADPSLRPWPGVATEERGACGPGTYAGFTVSGEPFFAWIRFGAAVSEEDRSALLATYESLSVNDTWVAESPDVVTPAYVIAGGTTDEFNDWRLELRPSERNVEMSLIGEAPEARSGFSVPDHPIEWCCKGSPMGVLFGAVQKEATGVRFQPNYGGDAFDGTILPLPPSLGLSDFDVFFIQGTEGLPGDVVALGVEDQPGPPVAARRGESVTLSGSLLGQDWSARFMGAFTGPGSPCIEVTIEGRLPGHSCPDPVHATLAGPSPYLNGSLSPDLYLLAGSVPPEIVEIRFDGDDDAIVPQELRCEMGPLGWTDPDRRVCAIALPSSGSGTLRYLDANGDVLFEEGIGWGQAEPELCCPVQPEQGGTYWAVYAWLGSGDQEAQIEEAQRYLEDRGVRGLRGSLFCDEGAAEALGTSAEHKVAVYFETEEEANAFALEAGLLGHEAGPVVAKVTIACLE